MPVIRAGYPILIVLLATACVTGRSDRPASSPGPTPDSLIRVTLLHLNDVYEIQPSGDGTQGGLARVATIRRQLLAENPNTYTVLAGDFLSPSALGTAVVDGDRLAGKQMVAVLNALGVDYATFGNHEFDVTAAQFAARLQEIRFQLISSNVLDSVGRPFPGVVPHALIEVAGPGGTHLRLGVLGVTLDENQRGYVRYDSVLPAVQRQVAALDGKADAIVALTHLSFTTDIELAERVPELTVILGGHEHENMLLRRGTDFTPILKADANVRSVYVHDLEYDPRTRGVVVRSRFVAVTEAIPEDPAVKRVVDEWLDKGFAGFRSEGFDPGAVVARVTENLDGLEASVRNRPTALTQLIAAAMMEGAPGTALALFNGGAIRIDDVIQAGPVTQYDVLRALPFEDNLVAVELPGDLLIRVLRQGLQSRGSGSYLQTTRNVRFDGANWLLNDSIVVANRTYRVAMNDYIAGGRGSGLEFLNVRDPQSGARLIGTFGDLRRAVIAFLGKRYPVGG